MRVNPSKLLVTDITEVEEKTAGGIFVPTAVLKQDALKGKVVLCGEGTPDIKMCYAVGETVLYHPRSGVKFSFDDKEYRLIDINEIFLGGL